MNSSMRPLAVVTGASSGIGLELARLCVNDGHDVVIAADEPAIHEVSRLLATGGAQILPVECDLSTTQGVEQLQMAIVGTGREVDLLLANAGRGLGHGFLDQDIAAALKVVHTNIDGTIQLIQIVGRAMRARRQGRILITGSIAGLMPGTFQAVYNGTKAFLDSFSVALSNELNDTGVTVTCLMPGATATNFFARAGMLDTKVGADEDKDDPASVARTGYEAMKRGELKVVSGFANKLRAAVAHVAPDSTLAQMHRGMAEPGSAQNNN
jgi:short-subunit dehydrogenase